VDYLVKGQSTGGVIGRTIRYVVERNRSQQALRQSEAFTSKVLASSMNGLYIYDLQQQGITFINPAYTKLTGYRLEDLQSFRGPQMLGLFHPGDRDRVAAHIRSFRAAGEQEMREIEYRFRTAAGRWIWCLSRETVFSRGRDGTTRQYLGTFVDITRRKLVEEELRRANERLQQQAEALQTQTEELRESEQRFRTLANAMPQLVWTAGPDGRVDYYNERYQEFQGITPTTDGSFHWAPVLHEDDVAPTVAAWERALRTGETYQIEHRVLRADGRYHWYLSRGIPVRDHTGRIVKWFGTATDIDNVKKAEEALREWNATLESRVARRTAELERRTRQLQRLTMELTQAEDRERQRLAELLHDDLQQQLAAAKFHLNLLSRRLPADTGLREALGGVEGMLKDAIEKSRRLSRELSPALLYHGDFREALEWLANQMQAKHGLVVHVEAHGPVEVSSDPIKTFLFRTAQEILFNAVKHARVTEATVRLRRRHGRLWLSVRDRGRGFDPGTLGQTEGFGLLSIHERAELLGGRMKIRSAPDRGSIFVIAVPDGPVPADRRPTPEDGKKTPAGAPASILRSPSSVLRVLLADDHEVMREGLAILLSEQEGIEIVGQAANGQEAVALVHELEPDVVLMDVAMPVMTGDEATRQIKQDRPHTRVVGLSMSDEPGVIERMHRAGADRYLLKTAPSEELLAALRSARDRSRRETNSAEPDEKR